MPHKLLLADDSVTIQRVIELTFADEDVQVIAVGNGQAAIERGERERPDIVLADVGMPERDGYEVAAFFKSHPQLSHVPVILLTGAFEPIDESRARAVGCDGVLVKPFEPQMVISRVKDLLSGKRPANMWSTGPSAQGPLRPAAPAAAPAAASRDDGSGHVADPLEAYFDRLDAAFSAIGTQPEPRAAAAAPQPEPTPPPTPAPAREPIPLSRPAPIPVSAQAPPPPLDLAGWDPDLEGDPTRPAPLGTSFPAEQFTPAAPPQESFAPAPPVPPRPAIASIPLAPRVTAPAAVPAPPAPAPAPAAVPPAAAVPVEPAAPQRVDVPSLADAFAALLSAEQRVQYAPSTAAIGGVSASMAADEKLVDAVAERVLGRLQDSGLRGVVLDAAERLVREEIDRIKKNV